MKYKIANIEDLIVKLERRDKNNRKKKYSERISELKSLSEGQEITDSLVKFIKRTFNNYQDYLIVVIEEEADVDGEVDVGADSGADDVNDGQPSKVGLAIVIVIVIAVAITFAMFIWYGVMAKKIKTANNSTPQATTQTITPTQAPTAKPTQKPTQVSTQAPAELPTFKGVAATEKTTEKAKSQQTQQAQKKVQIPQQRIVVEEYVVAETPQQSYIPEPTPSPSLSPSPQPEEEINSSRDSTVDEGVTGGNEGYGASISGQVESPVPEKIFEEEHPLPPAITQDEIEDIPPVVLTPAS